MKRYLMNGELLVSILILAVGIMFAVMANQFGIEIEPDYPGPKLFPFIACFGLIVCGTGMFFQSLKKIREQRGERFFSVKSWVKLGITMVILVAYAILLHTLGYFLATPLASFALVTYFAHEEQIRLIQRILFSAVFTTVIYLVYSVLFGLRLPSGLLF